MTYRKQQIFQKERLEIIFLYKLILMVLLIFNILDLTHDYVKPHDIYFYKGTTLKCLFDYKLSKD